MRDGWWVRRNDTARQPNAHLVFDTEAFRTVTPSGETQTFRCAVAAFTHRLTNADPWEPTKWARFESAEDLWGWVHRLKKGHGRIVVVAHNLAYDVRISAAMPILTGLGWTMEPPNIGPHRATFRFTMGRRSLVMIDSLNWLPYGLEKVGALAGHPKLPLPADDDSAEDWFARCTRDVEILHDAWFRILRWVEKEDLGTWQRTGAGMAATAWRHQHLTHRVWVHPFPAVRAAEREAAWCGRAEAWKVGVLPGGPWCEWDLRAAYGRIMAECEVPTIFRRRLERPSAKSLCVARRGHAVLGRVKVTTESPCVPYRGNGRVLWPVGTFETVLWDHEWALVEEAGGTVDVAEAWIYDRGPALRDFAEWGLSWVDPGRPDWDPIIALTAKHFLRAIVGKFGTRYWDWVESGEPPEHEFALVRNLDPTHPECKWGFTLGGQHYLQGPVTDSDQSCPQLLSWIQAETRVRLWRAIQRVGAEHVAYVDTDGLIVDQAGDHAMATWGDDRWGAKGTYDSVEILATRRIVLNGVLKASGVPKGAAQRPDGTWEADLWPEMATSLRRRENDQVRIRKGRWSLSGIEFRRRVDGAGNTYPHSI